MKCQCQTRPKQGLVVAQRGAARVMKQSGTVATCPDCFTSGVIRPGCGGATETALPGNPPPNAAGAAGGEGPAAGWDPVRSLRGRDARGHGQAGESRPQGRGRPAAIPQPA